MLIDELFWAKSPDSKTSRPGHGLLAHMLDVAACALALLQREPATTAGSLAKMLQMPEILALRWLAAWIGLHDFGKATPAFAVARGYRAADERLRQMRLASATPVRPANPLPHGLLSLALLKEAFERRGWPATACARFAEAVGIHHGQRFLSDQKYAAVIDRPAAQFGDAGWHRARDHLFDAYLRAMALNDAPPPGECHIDFPDVVQLAGLTSVADWIGSSLDYGVTVTHGAEYFANARRRAEAKLDEIGWHRRLPLADAPSYEELFSGPERAFMPRPLQRAVKDLIDAAPIGPTLLLIEAPMGEGKTEAALYAHCVLQARNEHRGLYFALPTQATGNAMFNRLSAFLAARDVDHPIDIQLAHGMAVLHPGFGELRTAGFMVRGIDAADSGESTATLRASEWFTANRRALLSEYGVGTVDQALVSVLPAKHHFVRLFGLANRVVVIDEVHAYDSYTGTLIVQLLRWLKAMGSSVIVMTATLPGSTRRAMLSAWGDAMQEAPPPYPRATAVEPSGASKAIGFGEAPDARSQKPVLIRRCSADVSSMAHLAIKQTEQGGCALVLANTIRRAQDIYRALLVSAPDAELTLFHARFSAGRRQEIEQSLLRRFGRDGAHRPHRAIVVATQVVEQSIDVDFDVLITDLAPMDLLLQRIGRMHRHERDFRPTDLQVPAVWIAGLDVYPEPPPSKACSWQYVYESAEFLLRGTAATLAARSQIVLPDDIDTLVQAVYEQATVDHWPAEWRDSADKLRREWLEYGKTLYANAVLADIGDPADPNAYEIWQCERDDDDNGELHRHMRAATRLGGASARILPVYAVSGGIALSPDDAAIDVERKPTPSELREFIARSIPVSHPGVVRALFDAANLPGLPKHPLLTGLKPILFSRDCTAALGHLALELDDHLGLVIPNRREGVGRSA